MAVSVSSREASLNANDSGFAIKIPFVEHLGFQLTKYEGGHSEIVFEARPEHQNTFDVTHGGAVMTLLDVSMATAARSMQNDMGVVTIEMKTSFMRPTRGKVTAKGSLMHRTATMAFVTSTIYDAKGSATAHATGTFKYVRRNDSVRPGAGGSSGTVSPISTD
jgi:uncharacterized protein (TIGR00369 family)